MTSETVIQCVIQVTNLYRPQLDNESVATVEDYLEHDEWALAFEELCCGLADLAGPIPKNIATELIEIGRYLGGHVEYYDWLELYL